MVAKRSRRKAARGGTAQRSAGCLQSCGKLLILVVALMTAVWLWVLVSYISTTNLLQNDASEVHAMVRMSRDHAPIPLSRQDPASADTTLHHDINSPVLPPQTDQSAHKAEDERTGPVVVQGHTPGKPHEAPPTTDVLRLSSLTPAALAKLDWLERGNWLLEQNAGLLAAAEERPITSLTLVTALVDLGRDKLKGGFGRDFSEYITRMKAFMAYDLPKILFLDAGHLDEFKPLLDSSPSPIHVIPISTADLRRDFPFFDQLQRIRTDKKWFRRQDWLSQSPQATLEYYNPLVMSKVRLARDAAKLNPFNTDGFVFLDAGHLCNNVNSFSSKNTPFIAENLMAHGMLATFFDYQPADYNPEVHGFELAAFQRYIGDKTLPLRVGRGGVFGGRPEHIAIASELFEVILEETLGHGFMGTEENVFSIIDYRFPGIIQRFDNAEGGNCAVFNYIANPPRDPEKYGYLLRHAHCEPDWKELSAAGKPSCRTSNNQWCPPEVTPKYLDAADGQWTCHDSTKFFCTVQCGDDHDMKSVGWSAHPCGQQPNMPCREPLAVGVKDFGERQAKKQQDALVETYDDAGPVDGVDLRGLACGRKSDGSVVCHTDDPYDREYCPSIVTPEYLTEGAGRRQCQAAVKTHFCTVACNPLLKTPTWHIHEVKWCKENPGGCPPMPQRIPRDKWRVPAYQPPAIPPRECEARAARVKAAGSGAGLRGVAPAGPVPELTLGMLVYGSKELDTVRETLETYEENGLLSGVTEMLIYMNKRDRRLDNFIGPWAKRFPAIKLMGDAQNYGIVRAFNWMAGNATTPYFMFLEKDFHLIEPWECASEELQQGVNLLKAGTAHVVKYRHRWRAGNPNWAKVLFKGKEEKVWKQQPNLFCNHYHWIEHPEKRWPNKIWYCAKDPYMYCVDSHDCNWTNNPVMISTKWWEQEYVAKFDSFKYHDPYKDIEFYMNWEPDAWNERHWIVAEGDGLFRHTDYRKWG